MTALEIIGSVFKPLEELIEHVVPSGESKVKLQQTVLDAQIQTAMRLMDYEKQLLDSQTQIIKAEAAGEGWLQRSWRPICMLTFLALATADAIGWLPYRLAAEAWNLLTIGLGGYVAGRSLEKIAPSVVNALANKGKK